MPRFALSSRLLAGVVGLVLLLPAPSPAQRTQKPVLHGRHWMAITGKPLGATAGSMMFQKGGNAIDAAAAMLAASCTMWDVLSPGEARPRHSSGTRRRKRVIGINCTRRRPDRSDHRRVLQAQQGHR